MYITYGGRGNTRSVTPPLTKAGSTQSAMGRAPNRLFEAALAATLKLTPSLFQIGIMLGHALFSHTTVCTVQFIFVSLSSNYLERYDFSTPSSRFVWNKACLQRFYLPPSPRTRTLIRTACPNCFITFPYTLSLSFSLTTILCLLLSFFTLPSLVAPNILRSQFIP